MALQTFDDFYEAQAAAGETHQVGGIMRGETPVYFLHAPDVDEFGIRELAHEAYHGEPMDDYARYVLREALAERA